MSIIIKKITKRTFFSVTSIVGFLIGMFGSIPFLKNSFSSGMSSAQNFEKDSSVISIPTANADVQSAPWSGGGGDTDGDGGGDGG